MWQNRVGNRRFEKDSQINVMYLREISQEKGQSTYTSQWLESVKCRTYCCSRYVCLLNWMKKNKRFVTCVVNTLPILTNAKAIHNTYDLNDCEYIVLFFFASHVIYATATTNHRTVPTAYNQSTTHVILYVYTRISISIRKQCHNTIRK